MPVYNSNVFIGREARDMVMRGVDMVADAVKTTLGSKGRNALLQEGVYPYHIITNDGISIAQKIQSRHPVENIGVNLMKEVADRANAESKDGTTTATVIAQAIAHAGIAVDATPQVMKEMQACIPIIFESIESQKRPVAVNEVAQAASVSAEDPKLGATLQEIYEKIGADGIVSIEGSGTYETRYEITDGVRLRHCGFMAPYMSSGASVTYKDPKVLITKARISTLNDIDPLFQKLSGAGVHELVMFVEEIDPQVIAALAFTHTNGIFKTLIIKAPTLFKDWLFEDFAAMTGATIVAADTGVGWKNVGLEHLGTCSKITTTRDTTIVTGIKDISAHLVRIAEEKQQQYELRMSWLKTRAATLFIGANSESELSYKRLKAEDAVGAAYLAMRDGVVPGGGVALYIASELMPDTTGGRILREALKSPLKQIIANAGGTFDEGIAWGFQAKGYDSSTGEVVDMWKAGIVDPAQVVKNSANAAISVAGTVLTTDVVITIPEKV